MDQIVGAVLNGGESGDGGNGKKRRGLQPRTSLNTLVVILVLTFAWSVVKPFLPIAEPTYLSRFDSYHQGLAIAMKTQSDLMAQLVQNQTVVINNQTIIIAKLDLQRVADDRQMDLLLKWLARQ